MLRQLVLGISLALLSVTSATAAPFEGTELLVGHGVKANSNSKIFSAGVTVSFAPLNVLLSSKRGELIDYGIQEACSGSADPAACEAAAKTHSDQAMDALGKVNESQWDTVSNAATDSAALSAALASAGLDAQQTSEVVAFVEQVPAANRKSAVDISKTLAKQEGSLFLVEPNFELNFDLISARASVPLAMMKFEDSSDWSLGNITLDVELGGTWGGAIASMGLSGGLMAYLPTGSTSTDALALSDFFQAPKYAHQYLGLVPYLAAGLDGTFASLQLYGQLVNELPVRDTEGLSTMQYLKWGTGVTLLQQYSPIAIIGEINGLVPVNNADLYDAVFAVIGVQLNVIYVKAAVAVQLPIVSPTDEQTSSIEGVDVGEMAKYSIVSRLMFSF